ncbi:DUF2000 domain-containing protein [Salipiger bermudensis]|uniref:DUF2000 domain-containing protein n=1 Tax=Salipiger bermudensis TaxID=344736 RepID=UPI001CD4FD4C|nr:DUF2000 domain-containing protein [Salipiger bermudensis]MCA0964627.1 DUF2000 domain-containing protein [Salipiger bermudensis]
MSLKPVIILDETLPTGLKTNFAAILGMSLGRLRPDLIGADTPTQDGEVLAGITTVALPVLGAPATELPALFAAAADLPLRLAYMRAAFEARDYADYTARIAAAPLAGHAPQAILLAGPRKAVDRLCGSLPLLR